MAARIKAIACTPCKSASGFSSENGGTRRGRGHGPGQAENINIAIEEINLWIKLCYSLLDRSAIHIGGLLN